MASEEDWTWKFSPRAANQFKGTIAAASQLPLMPERDNEFLRLALMSVNGPETHIDRLERNLDDLKNGIDHRDD